MDVVTLQAAKAAAKKAYQPIRRPGVVLIGDSRVAKELTSGTGVSGTSNIGPFTWGNALAGNRLKVDNYAGVSGETTTQILARWATDVTAYSSGAVWIRCGVNSATANFTAAQIQADFQTMFALALSEGKRVFIETIAPNNAWTTAQRAVGNKVNRWLKTQSVDANVTVVDTAAVVTGTDGLWLSSCSSDGLHQNKNGAARSGRVIAAAISSSFPPSDWLAASPLDTDNWLTNPWMSGTIGATAPTGWATSGTATFSTVARTDFGRGQWAQIDTTGGTSDTYIYQGNPSPAIPTAAGVVAGTDYVYGMIEVQFDSPVTAWTRFLLDLQLRDASDAIVAHSYGLFTDDSASTFTAGLELGISPATAILVTRPVLIPSTATKFRFLPNWNGVGRVRFGSAGVYTVR